MLSFKSLRAKGKMLAGLILMALFVACGGAKEEKSKEEVAQVQEKVFHLSGFTNTGSNDKIPWFWQYGEGMMPYFLYRALLIPDYQFKEVKPDLAKEYSISDDGTVYTFVMKDDIKWSDGEPITAEDVEFSIKTALKSSLINGIFPENLLKIVGTEAFKNGETDTISGIVVDGNKITMTLKEPVGLFSQILAQFFILPKHCLQNENPLEMHNSEFWKKPVTGGMYAVKEISAGNYIELEKNPYYEGKQPKINKIVYNFISDPVLALKDGKTYFYSTNKPEELSQLDTIQEITKYPIDILFYRYFIMNLSGIDGKGDSAIADKKVREAILYAIDRQQLADTVLQGIAKVSNCGVSEDLDFYYKDANKYEYNPEKAKELLKEANFDFSKKLKITYYYKDQTSVDLMQAMSYQLAQVGIQNEVIQIQNDPTSALFKLRKYDIAYKGLSSFGYESWYGEYSSNNTNFKNIYNSDTSFDELVQKLAATSDTSARKVILQDLQKLEQEKLLKLPVYTMQNFIYLNTSKLVLPEGLKLGNPFYRFDYKFEEWDIK